MKILLRVLLGLVVLVIVVVGAAYFVLTNYDRDELKKIAEEQAEAATGRKLTIAGPLDFKISLSPAITVEDVSFANARWGTSPEMAKMKRFELEVSILPLLTGSLQINRIVLIEPDIYLETDSSGRGNWELDLPASDETAESGSGTMSLQANAIVIKDGKVTYRDGVTGDKSVFALDSLTGSAPSASRLKVDAKGDADGTPFSLDADLAQSGESYTIDNAAITYGGTDLKGSGSIDLAGARPKIVAKFTSDTVDLTPFGGAAAETEGAPAEGDGAPGQYVFTEDPLPIGALRSVDADVNVAVKTIKVTDKAEVTDAQIVLTLNNGDLNLSKLAGASMKGTVDMNARLNGAVSPARLSTVLKVRDLDYGEVLKTMDISESVDGSIDFTVDLKGSGNSMRQIASGLNGYTEIVATDGVITNKLLAIVSTGLDSIVGPLFGGKKTTNLNCLVGRYDISGGLANTRALVVDSDTFTVAGEGTVDLKTEKLKLAFDTRTRQSALVSLAVPFRVEGTLASPRAYPDPLGAVKGAASAAKSFSKLLGKDSGGSTGDTTTTTKKKNPLGGLLGGSKDSGDNPLGGLIGGLTGGGQTEDAAAEPAAEEQDACKAALAAIGR